MTTLDFATLGADPTGVSPSDNAIAALSGYGEPVECVVPEGRYRLSADEHVLATRTDLTLRAKQGASPTLVAPADYGNQWLTIAGDVSIEGIDIDQTATGAGPQLTLRTATTATLSDCRVIGRDDSGVGGALLTAEARAPNATVTIEDFQATRGATPDAARTGVRVPPDSTGTVRLHDCDLREFSNRGVDAADAGGPLRVQGGRYVNSDDAQIRCGVGATRLHDTVCVVDAEAVTLPPDEATRQFGHAAGVRVEAAASNAETQITESTIGIRSGTTSEVDPAVVVSETGGAVALSDTVLESDVDGVAALLAEAPTTGVTSAALTLRRARCTGTAREGVAVAIFGRPDSVLSGGSIETPGARRAHDVPSGATIRDVETAVRTWS